MKYNPDCTKVVIFCYPIWGGGKFLINCLGLSNDCYLSDIAAARLQRNNQLSPQDKFLFLLDKINKVGDEWNDINLGSKQLFGNPCKPEQFYPEINEISHNNNKLFFLETHDPGDQLSPTLNQHLQIWPNAKTVYLRNANRFIKWRLGRPDEYNSSDVRHDTDFGKDLDQRLLDMNNLYVWDTECYFAEHRFIEELKKMYEYFGLLDFNERMVRILYIRYIKKLGELRIKNLAKHNQNCC